MDKWSVVEVPSHCLTCLQPHHMACGRTQCFWLLFSARYNWTDFRRKWLFLHVTVISASINIASVARPMWFHLLSDLCFHRSRPWTSYHTVLSCGVCNVTTEKWIKCCLKLLERDEEAYRNKPENPEGSGEVRGALTTCFIGIDGNNLLLVFFW